MGSWTRRGFTSALIGGGLAAAGCRRQGTEAPATASTPPASAATDMWQPGQVKAAQLALARKLKYPPHEIVIAHDRMEAQGPSTRLTWRPGGAITEEARTPARGLEPFMWPNLPEPGQLYESCESFFTARPDRKVISFTFSKSVGRNWSALRGVCEAGRVSVNLGANFEPVPVFAYPRNLEDLEREWPSGVTAYRNIFIESATGRASLTTRNIRSLSGVSEAEFMVVERHPQYRSVTVVGEGKRAAGERLGDLSRVEFSKLLRAMREVVPQKGKHDWTAQVLVSKEGRPIYGCTCEGRSIWLDDLGSPLR